MGGLGHHTALELARRGATVLLAGRNEPKLRATEAAITAEVPRALLSRLVVDLADLSSVRRAADRVGSLDVLVNNAGVMAPPYSRTVDGFESQMGTNHFGPFLLTGLLLPAAHRRRRGGRRRPRGHRLVPDAPHRPVRAAGGPARGAGRLPALDGVRPLQARQPALHLRARPAAHRRRPAGHGAWPPTPASPAPTWSSTVSSGAAPARWRAILDAAVKAVAQTPAAGALPTLMAATADLPGATYCGPSGLRESRGAPQVVGCTALARDRDAQRRLWELSEQAVGLSYP